MQVVMGLEVENGLIVVPAGYPGYEKYIAEHANNSPEDLGPSLLLSLPSLQLHLRTNDYYMGTQPKLVLLLLAHSMYRDVCQHRHHHRQDPRALLQRLHSLHSEQSWS